jgi:hypothetical protein
VTRLRHAAALEVGQRLLADADKLRLFLGEDFQAIFTIEWQRHSYTVTLKMEPEDED